MDLLTTIALAIKCSKEFEELTAILYENLSSLYTNNKEFSLAFKWLSIESYSHAKFMEDIYRVLNITISSYNCREFVGEPWRRVEILLDLIKKNADIDIDEVLNGLEIIEKFVGEETYSRLIYPLLDKLIKELNISLTIVSNIFSEIIEEEKYHENIIGMLKGKSNR
uniref:Rubrerythrin diiron-binding domain-containing protein n=1 Tax=Ignisphaera aggregans TaxID=334771 RepID=A0A7C5YXK3_9CREN